MEGPGERRRDEGGPASASPAPGGGGVASPAGAGAVGAAALPDRAGVEQDLLRLVGSVSDYAIFLLDPGGHVTTWNQGAENIKGWRREEIVGRHFSAFYPPEDVRDGKPGRELDEARRAGRFEDEGWRLRRDGQPFWANVIITALTDEQGALRGFGKVTRDLTARRRIEQALADERVARAGAEAAEQSAREAARMRDEFLAVAAHELLTPLTTTRLQLDGLQRLHRRGGDLGGERAEARLQAACEQAARLEVLVRRLVEVSVITTGALALDLQPTDLRSLCADVVARSAEALERAGCAVVVEGPGPLEAAAPPPLVGRWDPARLETVIASLLSNAGKFGAGRPIHVRLERVGPDAGGPERARLAVRDEGIGIAPPDQGRIFDRFARLQPWQHFGGLGLGLWLSRTIVAAHGGTLTVESAAVPAAGAGAPPVTQETHVTQVTFLVELPLAGPPSPVP